MLVIFTEDLEDCIRSVTLMPAEHRSQALELWHLKGLELQALVDGNLDESVEMERDGLAERSVLKWLHVAYCWNVAL